MSEYLFKCEKCGHEHEIQIKVEDLHKGPLPCLWQGCDGKLRRVYTPFYLRIK